MKAQFINEIEFNFDKPPYERYKSTRGVSRPPVPNPKKSGYGGGLSDEENEIIEKHQLRVQDLREEIDNIEYEIDDLKQDIDNLTPDFDQNDLEAFYSNIIRNHGTNILDVLNTGYSSDEEKLNALDKVFSGNDAGKEEYRDLLNDYNYYHPEEVDNSEKIEEINQKIKKLENQRDEQEKIKDKLETKIYNIENY